MLLANKTVAKHIDFPKKEAKSFVYRVHDLPDTDRISTLNNIVKNTKNIKTFMPSALDSCISGSATHCKKFTTSLDIWSTVALVPSSNSTTLFLLKGFISDCGS